jgi:gamma-glutamylcyclotransferase (GGCT)/AIG2-like uncharacterized protein YtfP
MRLFVYGSLKPGGWAERLLKDRVENPRPASANGFLFDCGRFPALKPEPRLGEDGYPVRGVLYDVIEGMETVLVMELDVLEAYPDLFDRIELDILCEGKIVSALTYIGKDENLFNNPIIPGPWQV